MKRGPKLKHRTCTIPGCEGKHLARGLCRKHYDAQPHRVKERVKHAAKVMQTPEGRANRRSWEQAHRRQLQKERNLRKYGTESNPRQQMGICNNCGGETIPGRRSLGMCHACYLRHLYYTNPEGRSNMADRAKEWRKRYPERSKQATREAQARYLRRLRGEIPQYTRPPSPWKKELE